MMKKSRIVLIFFFAMFVMFVINCQNGTTNPENNPPYAVTGPAEVSMDAGSGAEQTVTMLTDAPGLELDPDGDNAIFTSDPLPAYATLDSDGGVISVLNADWNGGTPYDILITIWIVDEHGLTSAEFVLTIHFGS